MSKKLGNIVKEARAAKNLTQTALAEQVDGVSASDIGKIERGEKEPSQAALKQMAKALGLTQKTLLEAAAGTSAPSTGKSSGGKEAAGTSAASTGKTSGGRKTSSGKTSGKASGKTSSSGKTGSSAKTSVTVTSLTATEKKLVQLYRKADSGTKKAAMNLLSGEGNAIETLGSLLLGNKDVSSMASGMFETLLQGKKDQRTGPEITEGSEQES